MKTTSSCRIAAADHEAAKAAAEQQKAMDEADLTVTDKDFAESQQSLAKTTSSCLTEMDDQKSAMDEADLAVTDKELAESEQPLAKTTSSCFTAAADHERRNRRTGGHSAKYWNEQKKQKKKLTAL